MSGLLRRDSYRLEALPVAQPTASDTTPVKLMTLPADRIWAVSSPADDFLAVSPALHMLQVQIKACGT